MVNRRLRAVDFTHVDIQDIDIDLVTTLYDSRVGANENNFQSYDDSMLFNTIPSMQPQRGRDSVARNLFGSYDTETAEVQPDLANGDCPNNHSSASSSDSVHNEQLVNQRQIRRKNRHQRTPSMIMSHLITTPRQNSDFDYENIWFYKLLGYYGLPRMQHLYDYNYYMIAESCPNPKNLLKEKLIDIISETNGDKEKINRDMKRPF